MGWALTGGTARDKDLGLLGRDLELLRTETRTSSHHLLAWNAYLKQVAEYFRMYLLDKSLLACISSRLPTAVHIDGRYKGNEQLNPLIALILIRLTVSISCSRFGCSD